MRSLDDILYIIFLRKWWIIVPAVLAPIFAFMSLLVVEPEYHSHAKLWAQERHEGSTLLRVERAGGQAETFVQVQREIILSSRVLGAVVDELGLATPPPSRSMWSSRFGQPEREPLDPELARLEAIRALAGSVNVEVINPEILIIDVSTNDPELARQITTTIVDVYRTVYLEMLGLEAAQYETYLDQRAEMLQGEIVATEGELRTFLERPRRPGQDPLELPITGIVNNSPGSDYTDLAASISAELGDFSPIPSILQRLAALELDRNELSLRVQPDHPDLTRLDREITMDREILAGYLDKLSAQARSSVLQMSLAWKLKVARERYAKLLTVQDDLVLSKGTKLRQQGSITVLDVPSAARSPSYPKKKLTLIAALVLGTFAGASLGYIIHLIDPTVRLADDLLSTTGAAVWADPPAKV